MKQHHNGRNRNFQERKNTGYKNEAAILLIKLVAKKHMNHIATQSVTKECEFLLQNKNHV